MGLAAPRVETVDEVLRPTESELADHLYEVHNLVVPPPEVYTRGHRYHHLRRLHANPDGIPPHHHAWED